MTKPPLLDNVSVTSLVAVTQTALGCGIGLLIAEKLARSVRRRRPPTAGIDTLLPAAPIPARPRTSIQRTWPSSARQMRKRLESIRDDSGFSEDAEVF